MILLMENERIEVIKDTAENINNATIHLKFKNENLTSSSKTFVFFNNKLLERINKTTYKVNPSILNGKIINVTVSLEENGEIKIFKSTLQLEKYFSFGKLGIDKVPQVIVDVYHRIEEIEKRIKKIEKNKKII